MSMTMPSILVSYSAQYFIFLRLSSRSSGTDLFLCGHPRTNGSMRSPSQSIKPTGVPTRVGHACIRTAIGHTVPSAIFNPRRERCIRVRSYKHWAEGWQGSATLDINGIKAMCADVCGSCRFVIRAKWSNWSGSRCVVLTNRRMRRWSFVFYFSTALTRPYMQRKVAQTDVFRHLQDARTHIETPDWNPLLSFGLMHHNFPRNTY